MFNPIAFGEKLKSFRKEKSFTQKEVAAKIGVSWQAISKWEKGECLPDVYYLKLLGRLYRVSVENLLGVGGDNEKILQTIKIEEAVFEVVDKPVTIYAGKFFYAKDYVDSKTGMNIDLYNLEINWDALKPNENVKEPVYPIQDVGIAINYFLDDERKHGYGYGRETLTENQPEGIEILKMPASLYVKAYVDEHMSMLLSNPNDIVAEVFPYIWDNIMPKHGLKIAENGAQDIEIYDSVQYRPGNMRTIEYLYAAAMRAYQICCEGVEICKQETRYCLTKLNGVCLMCKTTKLCCYATNIWTK